MAFDYENIRSQSHFGIPPNALSTVYIKTWMP